MFDFSLILADIPDWFTAAFALIVPTTFIGGLIAVSAGGSLIMRFAGKGISLVRKAK